MGRSLLLAGRSLRDGRSYTLPATLVFAIGAGAALSVLDLVSYGSGGLVGVLGLQSVRSSTWGFAWSPSARLPADLQARGLQALLALLVSLTVAGVVVAGLTVIVLHATRARLAVGETRIRRAVGASRRDLLLPALLEATVLTAMGLSLGAIGGTLAGRLIRSTWPGTITSPPPGALGLAGPGVLALGTVVFLAALLPLWDARRRGGLAVTPPRQVGRALPVLQFGLCLALLHGAGQLLERGRPLAASSASGNPGDTVRALGQVEVLRLAVDRHASVQQRALIYQKLLARFAGDPGIDFAGLASPGAWLGLGVEDVALVDCGACSVGGLPLRLVPVLAAHHALSPDTFRAMGVRLLEGRDITARDHYGSLPVAVVSRSLARTYFEGGHAVGRRIKLGTAFAHWYTVVGVVEDRAAEAIGGASEPLAAVYVSVLQSPPAAVDLVVASPPAAPVDAADAMASERDGVEGILRAGGGGVSVTGRTSLERERASQRAPLRWFGRLFTLLGMLALGLAVSGMHLTMRRRALARCLEVGVRRAMGARSVHIRRLVLSDALAVGAWGVALGVWLTFFVSSLSARIAIALPVLEPRLVLVLAAVLLAAAVLGGWGPARDAAAMNPARAIRKGGSL